MIDRTRHVNDIHLALSRNPVVAISGPRQCGKTTLAQVFRDEFAAHYFDMENPIGRARLDEPMTALAPLRGLVIIDEIQLYPALFPILRVLADRPNMPAQFLILGSASPDLIRHSSESLAGRVENIYLTGFNIDEVGGQSSSILWTRGGFPRSYVARNDKNSFAWRRNFADTFITRDVPAMGLRLAPEMLRRFWTMLGHYHGSVWNASELAQSLGVSQPTVRSYLDVLTGFFLVRQLQPWHENLKKRQVKSPKVYFRDSGLLHAMLGLVTEDDILGHPKVGASWEGFIIEQILACVRPDEAYFWSTHQGAEVDLLLMRGRERIGIEVKRNDAPRPTLSMHTALADLRLDRLIVVYPGDTAYTMGDRMEAMPVAEIVSI